MDSPSLWLPSVPLSQRNLGSQLGLDNSGDEGLTSMKCVLNAFYLNSALLDLNTTSFLLTCICLVHLCPNFDFGTFESFLSGRIYLFGLIGTCSPNKWLYPTYISTRFLILASPFSHYRHFYASLLFSWLSVFCCSVFPWVIRKIDIFSSPSCYL